MNGIDRAKRKIESIIAKSKVPEDPLHAQNTLDWLLKTKPDADEALQIAAMGHDIERAIENRKVLREDFASYDEFKDAHSRNSAKILKEIMRECSVPQDVSEEVDRLVLRHEVGGDPRSDLVNDSDSISFFDVNMPLYFERNGPEETMRRASWGYRRLSARMREEIQKLSYQNEELNTLLRKVIQEGEFNLSTARPEPL